MANIYFNYFVRFKKENKPDKTILETLVTDIKNLSENKTKELNKFGRMNINIDADGFSAGYNCNDSFDNEVEDFPTFLNWLSKKIPENEFLSNVSFGFEQFGKDSFEKIYICKNGEVNPVLNLHTPACTQRYDLNYMDKLDEMQNKASGFIEDYLDGKDYRYEIENTVLKRYRGFESEVIIPDGIKVIGDCAFENCTTIKSVVIPDGVTEIGRGAFERCTSLTTVKIPDSVILISQSAFRNCSLDKESLSLIEALSDCEEGEGKNYVELCSYEDFLQAVNDYNDDDIEDDDYDDDNDNSDVDYDDEDENYNPVNEMIFVAGGTTSLGSNECDDNQVHEVMLDDFYMAKYPVTQAEYEEVTGKNPSGYRDPARPVECVNWYDAVEFCNKLSFKENLTPCYKIDKEKKDPNNKNEYDDVKWTVECDFTANGYRLPTEAEWEYAARGGQKSEGYEYAGSNDLDEVSWYDDNIENVTHKVGKKKPNELGLYDMCGNVWQWIWDWYDGKPSEGNNPIGPDHGSDRVQRGGSCIDDYYCRLDSRDYCCADVCDNDVCGFRVCRNAN